MPQIEIKSINAFYEKLHVLKNIELSVSKGEIVSLIGPSGSYQSIPDLGKLILCAGMILGRLEIFAILVMFSPLFWKN